METGWPNSGYGRGCQCECRRYGRRWNAKQYALGGPDRHSTAGSIAAQTAAFPAAQAFDFRFPAGRLAVLQVPTNVSGALFLGVNDAATSMGALAGELTVSLYEAL